MAREYSPHEERLKADRRIEPDVRFVECQYCEGEGEIVTGTDWIGGVPDARIEPCPECDGTGRAETPVEPVECDDDLDQNPAAQAA